MFETEDMLPRPPPTPSAPLLTGDTLKPTVPEVSIIFGKQEPTQQQQTQPAKPPSYAVWKKQMLPRVTFPPDVKDDGPGTYTTRSSIYPMRTKTVTLTSASEAHYSNAVSEKSCQHGCQRTETQTATVAAAMLPVNCFSPTEQRRSMDSLTRKLPMEVLTICASTQTETRSDNEQSALIGKELKDLITIVKEMREEQSLVRQLLDTLLMQQQTQHQEPTMPVKIRCCDAATQCDISNNNGAAVNMQTENMLPFETSTVHQALPNVKFYNHTTPTTQRHTLNTQANHYTHGTPPAASLPKPNTEKSMVMNELALKYLPSAKLSELLQDAQITASATPPLETPGTPLRQIDNFTRAPTDISNASYKYLRKYRLLPDQNNCSPQRMLGAAGMPQTPPSATQNIGQSPYQQLPVSPLVETNIANTEPVLESPHIDLEHIRRQPKFL